MARDYAAIYTRVWADPDWRAMTIAQQHMYWLLLTQPKLSPSGVLDYMPRRWSRLAADLTVRAVDDRIAELCDLGMVAVDEDTGELLVRAFVRYDSLIRSGRPAGAVAADFHTVESVTLREAILGQLRRHRKEFPDLRGWAVLSEVDPGLMDLVDHPSKAMLKAV